jgi:hypothetical protein
MRLAYGGDDLLGTNAKSSRLGWTCPLIVCMFETLFRIRVYTEFSEVNEGVAVWKMNKNYFEHIRLREFFKIILTQPNLSVSD